ncbi:MAG: 1,2-diacylglycerol 3-alpha-glucosyltransferase [Candidatus Eremiobacteraeota bacterium]|nr:1,2-diacylglycerol 3-alpha-glucosyltransferase [Candidatus Eremiobacteraeota bacterium]
MYARGGAAGSPNPRSPVSSSLRVGFFTECYKPIVNGVVASIDALRDGLGAQGVEVTTVAPHFPRFVDDARDVVRIPSLPLPTATAYRLCVPYLNADDRARVRGIDLVHAHSPFVTGWMAAAYARNKRIPLVFTYHTRLDAYAHYAPFDRGTTERAMVELTRRYANAADAVVVPTPAMETRLRALGVHAPIAVVPSAIDVERFAAGRRSALVRARLGAPGGEPLALVVSRLGVEKNVELALDALARLPELRLAIVGEGPHRQALEERAQRLGVAGRVRFTGALARERLPDVYASVDAFVFPSTTDTQGLVLAEALAAGLPVVAAQSEASRDVLGEGGRIVAADPAALAPALAEAIAAGRDQSAVHLAFDRYTVELQTRRILELYREVLAARAA